MIVHAKGVVTREQHTKDQKIADYTHDQKQGTLNQGQYDDERKLKDKFDGILMFDRHLILLSTILSI
jgi:hypothetical protein